MRTLYFENDSTLSLEWIKPGTFTMGCPHPENPKWGLHTVEITEGFWMSTTTITNSVYRNFNAETIPQSYGDRNFSQPLQPVSGVTWFDAVKYCNYLTNKIGEKCSLPTEAEWEYACRAGTDTDWHFGNNVMLFKQYGWCSRNSKGSTQPTGFKKPNNWGLYDMHGNVWEWCQDVYNEDYYRESSPTNPYFNGEGSERVMRGGSYFSSSERTCSSFFRERLRPDSTARSVGFRIVVR